MSDIQRIVAFLQAEWRTGLRLTTIAQAMNTLRLPDDDEVSVSFLIWFLLTRK